MGRFCRAHTLQIDLLWPLCMYQYQIQNSAAYCFYVPFFLMVQRRIESPKMVEKVVTGI